MADNDLISFHRMLLADQGRMHAYRDAIRNTVTAGDVVLDAGSGSGILGLFACQAGARKVYCVERTEIIAVAQQLALVNGFADRMEFLRADVADIQIEKVDVLVSELIGKSAIGQNMTGIVGLCRDRWLKPDGRILPQSVDLWIAPVRESELDRKARLPAMAEYDLAFAPFAELSTSRPMSARIPAEALLAEGQTIYSYVAETSSLEGNFDVRVRFHVTGVGELGGFCTWFTSVLAPGVTLHNMPPGTDSWDNFLFMLPRPVPIKGDTTIELRFCGREGSPVIWIWDTTVHCDGIIVADYRQSSIF